MSSFTNILTIDDSHTNQSLSSGRKKIYLKNIGFNKIFLTPSDAVGVNSGFPVFPDDELHFKNFSGTNISLVCDTSETSDLIIVVEML